MDPELGQGVLQQGEVDAEEGLVLAHGIVQLPGQAAGLLILAEHIVALGPTARHIRIAAYGINEIVPLVILAAVLVDLYLIKRL